MPPQRSAAANNLPDDWAPYLGRKTSIRYRLRDDPHHTFSEAIGIIQSVEPAEERGQFLTILKRSGDTVRIESADIAAAKFF